MALLVAVFPANAYIVREGVPAELAPETLEEAARTAGWLRVPFQAVLLVWAWWCTRPMPDAAGSDEPSGSNDLPE